MTELYYLRASMRDEPSDSQRDVQRGTWPFATKENKKIHVHNVLLSRISPWLTETDKLMRNGRPLKNNWKLLLFNKLTGYIKEEQ